MSSPAYAELHAHSAFSFLDGASQPEEMVAEAARLGLSALAITDHNGLYGAVRHAKAAAEQGLSAVFGAELSLAVAATASGSAQNRVETVATLEDRTGTPDPKAQHLLVLARGPSGYKQLSSAIGLAHLASEAKARVEFSVEQLGAQAKGEWLVLAGCRKGAVRQALTGGGVAAARVELDRLMALFGAENVAVELPVPSSPAIGALHGALAGLAAEMRLPTVATTGAHYARPAQAPLAQALAAIRANSSLPTFEGFLPSPSAHLRSPAEMSRLFASFPQAVATAAALGKECSFDLRLVAPSLPPYPVPDGHTEATWLRHLVAQGGVERYGSRAAPRVAGAWEMLDHELQVIEQLDFPGYFLIVRDLVDFCSSRGILCQGRGSAANSAVCYALGITAVDAVKHGLLFERFLSSERDGPPDIDIDIESVRREEVIQYVYNRFGRTYAAQVANVISYRPRSAVREAAKALGYDVGQQDAWAKSIERWGSIRVHPGLPAENPPEWFARAGAGGTDGNQPTSDFTDSGVGNNGSGSGHAASEVGHASSGSSDTGSGAGHVASRFNHSAKRVYSEASGEVEPVYRVPVAPARSANPAATRSTDSAAIPEAVVSLAEQMLRLPRHLGIHSGGMVMCDRPVIEVCPVQWAAMEGRTVLQWDKEDCADAGLVKFDLLGLGMLTAIRYAFEAIAASQGVLLELHYLPDDDPAVYDLLCAADTVGVFQVESRAQMATLPRLKPRTFYDLVVEVALIRPGPIQGGSVHPYINRRNGREPVTYLHPLLESSLKRTLGIPLFQEQLMQMAIDVAGFSPAESDQLRRAMGSKRSLERMQALRDRLMSGMIANGVTPQARERIYEQLQGFADFGFPESHAFSFAFLVYASSWLKVHYPAEFYMGLLAAQPMGFYSPQSLCADARRHGVTVLRPCLNSSEALASVEALSEDVELPPEQLKIPRSPDESFGPEPNLRTAVREGLAQVRGISKEKAKEIVAERRARGPFRSQHDLARRVQLSTTQLESLATAGAMTTFGVTRRAGIWEADALAGESLAMLPGIGEGVSAPDLPTMSPVEAVMADAAATGITPDRLAIEFVRERLSADGVASVSVAMAGNPGTRIAVGGAVTHRQRPGTAGGVTFLSLEDETGLLNVVCQQKVWEQHREVARRARAMVVWGRLEKSDGATNLLAEHLAPLRLPVLAGSRDFR